MASVRFEHINKYFGKVEVVHDINLTVNDHEFVVLSDPQVPAKAPSCAWWQGWMNPAEAISTSVTEWSTAWRPKTAISLWCFKTMPSIPT